MGREVICFGEALIDLLASPPVNGQPRSFMQQAGGAPANVAVAVARLGGASQFVGMLGSDFFADFLLESLVDSGVGTAHVRRTSQAPTALAFVALDKDGERRFSFRRPPAADLLFRDADFDDSLFDDAAVFHFCSNSLTEPAIAEATLAGVRRARAAGVLVSFDINWRPALWSADVDPRMRIQDAAALADVIKFSTEELDFLADGRDIDEVLGELWQGATRWVIVTDAAAPVRWHTPSARGSIEGFDVSVVDTTGAGDAFVGGLLHQLALRGAGRERLLGFCHDAAARDQVLRYATACGALSVTRHGGFAGMPAGDEVEALLSAQRDR